MLRKLAKKGYGERMSIRLNSDTELVTEIQKQLKTNDGYCPCNIDKTPDTKCMCKEFRESEEGMCHCGLYIKTND